MKFCSLPYLLVASLLFTACSEDCVKGEGNRERDYRSPGAFNKLQTTLTGRVRINQDTSLSENEVVLEAQENVLEVLETIVEDSTLIVGVNDFECLSEHKDIVVNVAVKSLESLTLFDLGRVETSSLIDAPTFTVTINGNAKADLLLKVNSLRTVMNGSGEVVYRGEAQNHEINHNGPGSVRAYEMPTQRVTSDVNDFGNSYIRVIQSVDAVFNGDGNIFYIGNPAISTSGEGSGEVRRERN